MRKRSQAREFSLQVLYQIDITSDSPDVALESFWRSKEEENIEPTVGDFVSELVKGTAQNRKEIDAMISQFATNWQLSRMAFVDRNILRMGVFELVFRSDIPPKVSINEAVDLAKKYSGKEAGQFVNAILDKVKQEQNR